MYTWNVQLFAKLIRSSRCLMMLSSGQENSYLVSQSKLRCLILKKWKCTCMHIGRSYFCPCLSENHISSISSLKIIGILVLDNGNALVQYMKAALKYLSHACFNYGILPWLCDFNCLLADLITATYTRRKDKRTQ